MNIQKSQWHLDGGQNLNEVDGKTIRNPEMSQAGKINNNKSNISYLPFTSAADEAFAEAPQWQ